MALATFAAMRILAGTSGYAFKEWKGTFYPPGLPDTAMLGHYASKFPTVEINNTFYQLPKEKILGDWAAQVPADFTFSLKASRRITHFGRLKPETADVVKYMLDCTKVLGEKLGPILFQLPPNLKKDVALLNAFLDSLPAGRRYALEFRHESWFDDAVLSALHEHDAALVLIEQEDFATPITATASWTYMRPHRLNYSSEDLAAWAERVRYLGCEENYVYFKHDESPGGGSGPPAVAEFMRLFHGNQL